MSKLQKSKTLSLGRLATLSTIKENLRVKTTFHKNELPLPSPTVLLSRQPNNLNGGGDTDAPPLLFSAISNYKAEKTPRSAAAENATYDQESSNYASAAKSPRKGLEANGLNGRPTQAPAGSVRSDHGLFVSPKFDLRIIPEGNQQQQSEEDSEPELFQPKLHRLYHSTNGPDSLLQSVVERDFEGAAHGLDDADGARLQLTLRGIREEIFSCASSRSSRSSGYGDDLEEGTSEDGQDEEYWSIPPKVSGLAIDRRDLATGEKL